MRFSAPAFAFAAVIAVAPAAPGSAAPQIVTSITANTYDFRVGDLRLTALKDGETMRANDGRTFRTPDRVRQVLTGVGLNGDKYTLNFSGLLVRDGARNILIDTGLGYQARASGDGGRLADAIAAAGVKPEAVTDIILSHPHFDHVGGLLAEGGKARFPNAKVHMTQAVWDALKASSTPEMRAAVEPRLAIVRPGETVAPGVTIVDLPGHTPGHIGVEIRNRGQKLLYAGDAMHHYVISVRAPDISISYDADDATAQSTRKALIERAARTHELLYLPHFPFPGLGHIVRDGDNYAWAPVRG